MHKSANTHAPGFAYFETVYFSLPYNVTHTPIGLGFTLVGQIFGEFTAIPFSTIVIGLFATLMSYVTAFFEDTSKSFVKLDENVANDRYFRAILLDTMKLHNWAIS